IDTIINWYSKLSVVVRWCGYDSSPMTVPSGVRQGGILSPLLFNLYVNCILTNLRRMDKGCHIRNLFLGCMMYADDLLLISASVIDLQRMLDMCGAIGVELGINLNCKSRTLSVSDQLRVSIANL